MTISVKALLLCQLAEDVDTFDDLVRAQLAPVLRAQERLSELIAQRDTLAKAHEILSQKPVQKYRLTS